MYIVAFNGPPRSGKDTLAEMLAEKLDAEGVTLPVKFESLSLPLRDIAYAMVGLNYAAAPETYEDFKQARFEQFGGVTGRQLMIDVSEKFIKPTYGIDSFPKMLLERNWGFPGILLVRDSGFQLEVETMTQAVGLQNIRIVQVHRPGTTFEGDSREWVFPELGREFHRVNNNGTLEDLRVEAGRVYSRLVNNLGWKL